ncbi:hypothetical protein FGIG_10002 [Fasciola gigantica]|uniref:Integrator complex subunit 14 n=1 Tax=Fasciola gigantica TaxID=46835 RepID=A0A504YQ21_FASGI|nr:hypothetical protein FGIG_10002 [Fasciola gigantica]
MSWALMIDDKISLLRPHELLTGHSYHDLCKTFATSVAERLCEVLEHDCLTVIHPDDSNGTPVLHPFMCHAEAVRDAVTHLAEPNPITQRNRNFSFRIECTIAELFKYWGPAYPIQLVIFTDGGASSFTNRKETVSDSGTDYSNQWPNVSLIFVSMCDEQLSEDLAQVHRQFAPNSVILPLGTHQVSSTNLTEIVTEGTRAILRHCLAVPPDFSSIENLTPVCAATRVSVRFGHLGSDALLLPALRPTSKINLLSTNSSFAELILEIFGFLHISDLSNPPVASRHQVRIAPDTEDKTFLSLLLAAMQNTKTVAMCTLCTHDSAGRTKSSGAGPQLWRHGFLHQYDTKLSVLLLSVFPHDCTGLPWIGQFQHLAPVTDFAGTQLYDDRDGSSPFPVRVPDRLSYVSDPAIPGCPVSISTVPTESFRYVSWVSPATLTADVNKLLRLGRRLPDKAPLFFKEFVKLRTAALAYGCLEILNDVVELTKSSHPSYSNGTAPETLKTQLDSMCRMLAEPDFRPS